MIAWRSLVALFNALKQRYPGMGIEVQVDLNANLLRLLSRGEIDLAVLGGPIEASDLRCQPIGAMALGWIGAPSLLAGRSRASPAELAALPILSLGQGARLHAQMHAWFAQGACTPSLISACNSISTMLQAVRAGIFVCLAPLDLVADDLAAGRLALMPADPPLPLLTFFVATRRESVDPALDEVARLVADITRLPGSAPAPTPAPAA